jgi:hypothetical protein
VLCEGDKSPSLVPPHPRAALCVKGQLTILEATHYNVLPQTLRVLKPITGNLCEPIGLKNGPYSFFSEGTAIPVRG